MIHRFVALLGGAFGLLVLLEMLFQPLPVSTATARGYHIDPLILTYPPGHRWRVATGWDLRNPQTLRANNLGFASEIDFTPDPRAVALVGDSFVEASMIDAAARPGPQLQALLAGRHAVYAFGAPGSALLDYAERIRLASDKLGVREFVILLEPGDIRQSLCGSGNAHGPCLDPGSLQPRTQKLPPPTLLKRVLSHSALAQFLFGQLKLDGQRLLDKLAHFDGPGAATDGKPPAEAPLAEAPAVKAQRERMVQAVADRFFARIEPYPIDRLVFVVVGRHEQAELADPQAAEQPLMRERRQFMRIAAERGARVVDTEPVFGRHWQHSELSLAVGPYDGHLNALGVRLAMQAAAEEIE